MILIIIALILVLYCTELWSIRNAMTGIRYRSNCSKILVEPDAEFDLISTISNRSRRFVPFIGLEEILPSEATVHMENAVLRRTHTLELRLISSAYLMPKSSLERRVSLSLPARGKYLFLGANLRIGDFLGLRESGESFSSMNEIVVYPKVVPKPDVNDMLGGFLGEISARRYILEDPVLAIGAREYTGREPMKNISWNHSARLGRLMVRQFDYTIEPSVSVMLDINASPEAENASELIESCFSLARSVCMILEEKSIRYDFITNATTANAISRWSYMAEGQGSRHYYAILEGLGRASLRAFESFSSTITRIVGKQEQNKATIIITPDRNAEKRRLADRLQNQNGGKAVFLYGEDVAT